MLQTLSSPQHTRTVASLAVDSFSDARNGDSVDSEPRMEQTIPNGITPLGRQHSGQVSGYGYFQELNVWAMLARN